MSRHRVGIDGEPHIVRADLFEGIDHFSDSSSFTTGPCRRGKPRRPGTSEPFLFWTGEQNGKNLAAAANGNDRGKAVRVFSRERPSARSRPMLSPVR